LQIRFSSIRLLQPVPRAAHIHAELISEAVGRIPGGFISNQQSLQSLFDFGIAGSVGATVHHACASAGMFSVGTQATLRSRA
jgi:hypothetical protein